jgi:leucyl-tRNA synthetase
VFVANDMKRAIYSLIAKEKKFDLIMKAASQDARLKTQDPKLETVQRMAKSLMKNAYALPTILSAKDELAALKDAEQFLSKEFGCPVSVQMDEESKHERAKNALPGKPSIVFD